MKRFPKHRQQRRAKPQESNEHQNLTSTSSRSESFDSEYYNKGHRHDEDRIFKDSCSLVQFVLNPCRCLFHATISVCTNQSNRRRKTITGALSEDNDRKKTVLLLLLLGIVAIAIVSTSRWLLRFSVLSYPSLGRPLTDEALNEIPVQIPIFEFDGRGIDIGGWNHVRRFFHPKDSLDVSTTPSDFGGLDILMDDGNDAVEKDTMLGNKLVSPQRLINPNDDTLAMEYWNKLRKHDHKIPSYYLHTEELEDTKEDCRAPNWAKKFYPLCNPLHEMPLGREYNSERAKIPGDDQSFDSFYISYGAYRSVWVLHQPYPDDMKFALKMMRYKHDYEPGTYWKTLNDALVMERLTASPRIVDIYGHCGATVWVEAMPNEVEEIIVKGEGMAKQKDLPSELTPLNPYTVEEKLDMALYMAESLADLHGFADGVIVHDDVQLCQWLRTKDGRLKLGDFNRAEVMDYNAKKGEYCAYSNGSCGGNYRAPEEYAVRDLNEQIDVYSFGNNIYSLLLGLWVFYDVDDDEVVQKKVIDGTRAFIDPRWKKRTYIESELVELMEKCWLPDVNERIDIFGAVKRLREIKAEDERRKAKI